MSTDFHGLIKGIQQERTVSEAQIPGIQPPYFQCICGTKAMPLTDDTMCDCKDYYDQEWTLVNGVTQQATAAKGE